MDTQTRSDGRAFQASAGRARHTAHPRASVFVVEDEELVRVALEPVLEGAGYEVAFAANGDEALTRLRALSLPDIILLDLGMPAMNGWEFRAIQKNDPRLGCVPVVALSADRSPQAVAISAEAYIHKPFCAQELLATIDRILEDKRRNRLASPIEAADRLAALEGLASRVGHEINNPLTVVLLNLEASIRDLGPAVDALATPLMAPLTDATAEEIRANLVGVTEMLKDGQTGGARIRDTVAKLSQLNRLDPHLRAPVDVNAVIDRALLRVWNKLGGRTRLVKALGKIPEVLGQGAALEQAFVNLLLNAVEAIPADDSGGHEIRVVTSVRAGASGTEAVVEIYDTGIGLSPAVAAQAFDPLFSTKPVGSGDATGLGLAVTRRIVTDHGGRVTVEGQPTRGAVARVVLPIAAARPARRR